MSIIYFHLITLGASHSIVRSDFGEHKIRTVDEWTSVLHLATRWEFDSIRTLAIQKLEGLTISAVDKVVLARQFNITSPWTLAAYTDLCQRPETLTFLEARALGLETAMRIYQLRETLRGGNGRSTSRNRSGSLPRGVSGLYCSAEHGRTPTRRETVSYPPRSARGRATLSAFATGEGVKTPVRRLSDASRLVAKTFDIEV
jgi:hypothetical protein